MKPLALYVHWPFCRRICPYCDFNVKRWRNQDTKTIARALLADLKQEAAWRGSGWQLEAIHFGGGTPSMMPPEILHEVVHCARELFPITANLEIALEANPEDIEHFPALADAGVTRLTLGIQALDGQRLKILGRQHSPEQALDAIKTARTLFSSVAVDMIYATPHQSLAQWQKELFSLTALDIDHLSLYGLTIEAGTAFGRRPPEGLPDNSLDADLMLLSREITTQAGFQQYEVSNFAKGGHQSRYNRLVWRSGDYIGIGPGAHGRHHLPKQRYAVRKLPDPKVWQEAMIASTNPQPLHGLESLEALDTLAAVQEWLLMGLRLCQGIDLENIPDFVPVDHQALVQSMKQYQCAYPDIWVCDDRFMRITKAAALRLDYHLAEMCIAIEHDLHHRPK